MFNDIEADLYVLVDGDATYDAPSAQTMIDKLVADRLDMVVAARVDDEAAAYRPGHRAGNWLLTGFVATIFSAAPSPTFFPAIACSHAASSNRFQFSPAVSRSRRN